WRRKLAACKSKKAVWALNERRQAYETFTSHRRGKSLQEVIQEQSDQPFYFSDATHILSVCGIESTPESLATVQKPTPPPSLPRTFQDVWERGYDFRDRGPLDRPERG